ncbi:M56 family metallopeptidase [Humibacter ginsenosidimutans]|uniref:M56 family metallopeptidase n=1 Tax=Humibacter ginsenosidimutans TaxID=2599293 RepID=A0A5B8M1J9_9MICO|nr:M56 family metallopeptidase [Humibacter ginsenosidimutans]QDZ13570.1 M56 family metallopeptidase [Humibacter ginsenosidimutans]
MVVVGLACLFAVALVTVMTAPTVITRGGWRLRFPRLALAVSHALTLVGLACAASTLVWTLAEVVSGGDRSGGAFWLQPTALTLFGWVGLAAVGGLITVIVTSAEPMTESDRRLRLEFSLLEARGTSVVRDGIRVVTVPSDRPVALSVPGPQHRILIASGLMRLLTEDQLRAVVEHERAHLVQHHGMLTRLARLNRACFAFIPGTSEIERSTRMLVELIADDTAARHAGAVNLANALWRVGSASEDAALRLRARRLASHPPRGSSTLSSRVRHTLAASSI